MDGNWRPAQGDAPMTSGISAGEWRSQLPPESRQKIVNKIMDTLKRHLPISVPEGLNELRKIAVRFEEKIYTAAVSQEDYLRKISLKMLSMESKTQQPAPINPAMSISGNQNPAESGPHVMHSQGNNSTQGLLGPNRHSIPQNIQNNISVSMQGSSVLASTLPAMSALTQSNISSVQNMPGMSQASVNNPIAQGGQNDIYANAQRMLQGRQQLQQQQSQNSSLYQNQLLLKQKMQQSSLLQPQATQASLMQMSSNQSNNIQQAQAANMQSSQQQQNHIQQSVPTMLQPNSQSAANQQGSLLQQQAMPVSQQTMGQQRNMSNISNMQQSHPHSQHNNISEQQQQQQRMPIQQNNLLNIQPQQIINQQQLNSQSNMSGLQQHLLGSMPAISNMQPHRTMMMPKNAAQQQSNQPSMSMLQTQGQQAQHQSPQQLMSQFQNQSNQMQQQMLMQQHSNSMQREIQQRIQGPNNLLQGPAGIDQKPFIQAQRLPEVSSSTSIESTTGPGGVPDWQEECYQKVKSMRELYYNDIKDFHEKIDAKLEQQELLGPPGNQSEQLEKLKTFRHMLDRMLTLLNVTKSNIPVGLKDKLPTYETQIVGMIASHRSKKAPPQGQGKQEQFQHPVRTQQPSLVSQLHLSDNSQVNTVNLQGSGVSLQNMSMHSPATHQSASNNNTMQSAPNNNDPILQASSFNSMQQSGQQNSMNASQQNNTSTLNQNAMNNTLQSNVGSMQSNTNVLHQHVKQEQQQLHQTHQSHQLKQQLTHRHLQQMHQQRQQQLLQHQQQQQQKQQLSSQPSAHQVQQQLQPMNEPNELKPRQVSGNKFDFAGQRQHYYQQIKSVTSHPSSSPQNLQASSPQISYHSSPQIDQNGLVSSIPKANTPHIPSGNSPLAVTSTPFVPSPIQVEHEKPITSISQLGHGNHQQSIGTQTQSHAVAVNTPGISASPLLEECPPLAGNQSHVMKLSETGQAERPMDRLIKVIRTLTPHALSSSVSDIGSVVSMVDRIAGSAPGNGSRTAVGEDLVAMTKCRLQARNFMSHDVGATSKKMKRHTSAMPLNNVASAGSVNDSFKHFHGLESSELESTATSSLIKRFKSQISHCLREEIREINQKLIDTVVDICDEDADSVASSEDGDGAVVKCSYTAVALSSDLKAQLFATAQTFPIAPLRLLVPVNYPKCSPVLLDSIVETSMECEEVDLSTKAKSKFSISIRCLSQPMSLKEMVKTWDACVRKVILEYAQQFGGGSFSSTFGSWEYCIDA